MKAILVAMSTVLVSLSMGAQQNISFRPIHCAFSFNIEITR